ncbi:substrate-binding domain-containing protein [Mycolicibacterium komossense]|uniref:Substrate-binding domain-containing protein n=1 Tax=Mycolicibacterium komossense TaxID=1779 RepID=A0ABT3CID4_9MYCO|nr:substrate-binding domain-containing protein [Mycolicibacterium komossense]MCV7229304.1 substrate-binding domain-containing protein [Mycolicibacterium komossense]
MGRHSIPGPDDSGDERADHPGDGTDGYTSGEYDGDYADEYDSDYEDGDDYADDREGAEHHAAGGYDVDDPPSESRKYTDDYTRDYTDAFDDRTAVIPAQGPSPQASGGHVNTGEWTGSHRTVVQGRRGVSMGVIAALVTVVVVVAAVILWRFFGDALTDRSRQAAATCLDGKSNVAVLADPSIAELIGQSAKTFNESAKPVGDKCLTIEVKAADSDAVVGGLIGTWPADLGEKPALWIPGSSVSVARLQTAVDAKTISASKSLVTSPVLLAIRPELKTALDAQNWSTLPGLQNNPTGLDGLNLPGWGDLRLALPMTGDSDAAYLAAEAVAAASAPAGAPPAAGSTAVSQLVAGQPKLATNSTDDAMNALLQADDPATAPVHAVVTTEQQLFSRAATVPNAKSVLSSWLPPGPVAVADFPAVLFGGDWLGEEQVSAASEFERFLRKPEQLATLAKAGFRTEGGGAPPASDVTSFAPLGATLSVGDDTTRAALANALSTPATGPATTIMLDRSLNMGPIATALDARIAVLPTNAAIGLTTFDGSSSTTQVALGPLGDDIDGKPRSQVLTSTLQGLTSTGGAVSFTTLRNVYAEALTNFRQGQNNSVLVITSGPHTDQSLDATGLQDLIRRSADPARPVAVDVINVGNDPDRSTWESVAQISGGTYQNVPASDSPELVAAVNSMLS